MKKFLKSPYQETRDVDIATITGVGSSSLGSAALAWDISVALKNRCWQLNYQRGDPGMAISFTFDGVATACEFPLLVV